MLAIATRFHGPTNTRGSRVSARVMEPRRPHGLMSGAQRRRTLNWDHALDSEANHRAAATALIRDLGWTAEHGYGRWIVGGTEDGYVFVCDTRHGTSRLDV